MSNSAISAIIQLSSNLNGIPDQIKDLHCFVTQFDFVSKSYNCSQI